MKICNRNNKLITFDEINFGDCFILNNYKIPMMKIRAIQQVKNNDLINAIGLDDGNIYSISPDKIVTMMENVELLYD